MSSQQVFPLLSLPNELIVAIAQQLPEITDLHSFLLTNRRLSLLLTTALQTHAANSTLSLAVLYWAISTGNRLMTALLLQKSTQILTVRTPSHTLLHRTPHPCPEETLSLILAHEGAIQVEEEATGRTPQHSACEHSRPNLLSRILAFGAAVEVTDRKGWTPLHLSVISRHEDHACTQVLLARGADLSARTLTLKHTPLHFATKSVRVEELREFLDQVAARRGGLNVDVADGYGQTPLHWAAGMGKAGVVEVLLQRDANVGARDRRGLTALDVVATGPYVSRLKGGFEAVARLLIRHGADGTIRDRSGSRVMDILEGRRQAAGLE